MPHLSSVSLYFRKYSLRKLRHISFQELGVFLGYHLKTFPALFIFLSTVHTIKTIPLKKLRQHFNYFHYLHTTTLRAFRMTTNLFSFSCAYFKASITTLTTKTIRYQIDSPLNSPRNY